MTQSNFLFLGDSLIADFDWQTRMRHFEILNHGVPGETVQGLRNRLPALTKTLASPDLILIMIGTNNLIIEDFSFMESLRQVILTLTTNYPTAEVITNSLFPCQLPWVPPKTIQRINTAIETLTKQTGSCYLKMFDKFEPSQEFFLDDGIHLTEKAYDIWAKSILEYVSFLIEDDQAPINNLCT